MASDTPGALRRYRAFIAYSHADARWAAWLHRRLEAYRLPRRLAGRPGPSGPLPRKLGPLFRDREELATATDLGERIEAALAASDALIVICSPAAARSRWVDEEVRRFRRRGRNSRILCLIVGGEPLASDTAGREARECFPPALREARADTGARRPEPLASDVRPGGDGRHLALLKLVAGLLDLNLDELRRREQQHRARRWAAVAGVALAVMTATSLLALEATIQRQAAERRQQQAETLVRFMLGNFTDRLRKVGRLDILESLDEQAMKYFESLPPGDVDDGTLAQRAKALEEIGNTRSDQGDYGEAREAFQAELAITSALAAKHPDDPQRLNALGYNLVWLGVTYWAANELDAAEKAINRAVANLEKARTLAPKDTKIQLNLAYAYDDLGHIAEARGERDKAWADWSRYMQISLHLVATDTNNRDWQNNLGDAYDNLGKLAVTQGNFVEAVRNYQEEQLLSTVLLRTDPSNQEVRSHLVRIDGILGRTLFMCGQWQAGVSYLRKAVKLANDLVAYDATQTGWRYDRAHYATVLADLLREQGDADSAASLVKTSLTDLRTLTAKDPTHRDWRVALVEAQVSAALIAQSRRQYPTARRLATAALQSLAEIPKSGPDTPDDPRAATTATALLLLAELAHADGDRAGAAGFTKQAMAAIVPATHASGIPTDLAVAVSSRVAAGDIAGARDDIDRLRRMGFRTPAFVSLLERHGIAYPENPEVSRKIKQLIRVGAAGASTGRAPASGARSLPSAQPGEAP